MHPITHSIHVWYIYLHLPNFTLKHLKHLPHFTLNKQPNLGKYTNHTWMVWVMSFFFFLFRLRKVIFLLPLPEPGLAGGGKGRRRQGKSPREEVITCLYRSKKEAKGGKPSLFLNGFVRCFFFNTWNAKCPIFVGNFTPKTSNYCLKNRVLGFPGYSLSFWCKPCAKIARVKLNN